MSEMRYEVRGKLLVLPYWWWLFESTPPLLLLLSKVGKMW